MTRIGIRIEHQNLPLSESSVFKQQLSAAEIEAEVAGFPDALSSLSGDDTLSVAKGVSVRDKHTIFVISSSTLDRSQLMGVIEEALAKLGLGGAVLPEF